MKPSTLVGCAIVCAAAVTLSSAGEAVSLEAKSVPTILPEAAFDVAKATRDMSALHDRLVSGRVDGDIVDLGPLSKDEAARIQGVDSSATRRLLVGIDRPVATPVDLAVNRGQIGAVRTKRGSFVWTATFRSPGATGVRAHLTDIDLPKGAELFVYGQRGDAFGPYTGSGILFNNEIWTNTVSGDTITLQLEIAGPVTREQRLKSVFMVESIGHMGDRFELGLRNDLGKTHCTDASGPVNADCVENAQCGSVGPAGPAESAVAAMLYQSRGNFYICSGGLLSNNTSSPPNYFLTANHCISKGNEASSLETYWDHTASCGTRSCDYGWAGGRATPGGTILRTSRTSDYTLLELPSVPSGRAYLGWNSSNISGSNGANLYRISHPDGAPQAYSTHSVDTSAGTCTSWPRGNWIYSSDTFGATEGGSSGSPVLNSAGEVVGQLSGGCGTNVNDTCDSVNNATVDGALAAYFSSVSGWLDGGTGCTPSAEVCDGVDNDCDGDIDEGGVCDGGTCELGQIGDSCSSNADCCSNKCRGPRNNGTCR